MQARDKVNDKSESKRFNVAHMTIIFDIS